MKFTLEAGSATGPRAGTLELRHGTVRTPAFMPVGTRGTVKAVDTDDLRRLGVEILLGNTYHLWTAPGAEAVAAAGGLHGFAGWERNILTDSGGYQAVSLVAAGAAFVDEDGVLFDAPGGTRRLSPERAVKVQERLAPDIMMVLDEPVPYPAGRAAAVAAMERTHRWAERCLAAWSRGATELFGIVQGGFEADLRRESAQATRALGFPGYGIGGLSLGEPGHVAAELLPVVTAELEVDKPRYLMGVGSEPEMLAAIGAGVDLFDCVWPTRLARTGAALVGPGRINLHNQAFALDAAPIEAGCTCMACTRHTRAQLRYLCRRGELLGHRLLTIHNLHHTLELVRLAGDAARDGSFAAFAAARLAEPSRL